MSTTPQDILKRQLDFTNVSKYHEQGLWSKERVYNVVGKVITAEEYKEITGEPYIV
jgi:hypothetical protein